MDKKYEILDIHELPDKSFAARVRMFIGTQIIDEDIALPTVKTFEESLSTEIDKRVVALEAIA